MNLVNYEKRKNQELFKTLENSDNLFLSKTQNYIPIYHKFFVLNETNYNNVNLNHKWFLSNIVEKLDDTIYICKIKNINTQKTKEKEIFFKIAPLLDPYKYLVGKYNANDENIYNLPNLNSTEQITHPKMLDQNNSAYVDGLFVFFSSILLHKYKFIHSVDYYGSFLAIKNEFKLNVFDDIDYLNESDFFNKNKNVLFKVDDYSHLFNVEGIKLKPIQIQHNISAKSNISLHSLNDYMFDNVFGENENVNKNIDSNIVDLNDLKHLSLDLIDITHTNLLSKNGENIENENNCINNKTTLKSGSTCSSRTSHTSIEDETQETQENENDCNFCGNEIERETKTNQINSNHMDNNAENNDHNVNGTNENYDDDCEWEDVSASTNENENEHENENNDENNDEDNESDFVEEKIEATINKFPVEVICMENCEDTFDNLILLNDLSDDEWFSALMQIIMILITFQKTFAFTHNDLHTNNVMYVTTTQKYLNYCYKKKYYKVPTYGRLFKIIDFGRSIYKYDGKVFCSDSFKYGGDAASQYNIEPYFDEKKPRLEPNYSFDLCRLACSIFDYLVDDMSEIQDMSSLKPIKRLIVEWCLDDKGINLLYKNNGAERYPDFKLYKMIARCVHNHTPHAQLERPEFNKYCIPFQKLTIKNDEIINIDNMECFA